MQGDNGSAHILVVDDETSIRYSVSKTLQRVGYTVYEAASGQEALDLMDLHPIDVVLTDIKMPNGIDGVELVRRIKEANQDMVVILMTGYPSLATAVEALRLGAHDYLIKPSSSGDVRQSVAQGIERAQNLKRRRALLDVIRSNVQELTHEPEIPLHPLSGRRIAEEVHSEETTDDDLQVIGGVITLGTLKLFPGRYQIAVNDHQIDLTPTEFDLLLYLAAHRGRVVSCHELVREVRGYNVAESEAREVIRPHVSNLRRKLKNVGDDADLIHNIRGIGYRLSQDSVLTE